MICAGCGTEAIALKTVICRDDRDRRGTLCDACWEPVRHRVWVIPGSVACFGRCRYCSGWFSVNELADLALGGKHGAWFGTCEGCSR